VNELISLITRAAKREGGEEGDQRKDEMGERREGRRSLSIASSSPSMLGKLELWDLHIRLVSTSIFRPIKNQ